jgi:hypothetical protein
VNPRNRVTIANISPLSAGTLNENTFSPNTFEFNLEFSIQDTIGVNKHLEWQSVASSFPASPRSQEAQLILRK